MPRLSANLGFLWTELSLPDAIRAAAKAGFEAVECHWPYDVPVSDVQSALAEAGVPMLGLNTRRGDVAGGENGLAALPGREADARAAIDEAIAYATSTATGNIHVMAGFAAGGEAHETFAANLTYACDVAAGQGITILIEPLNRYDAPGYFLSDSDQAVEIINAVGRPNLKLMFDCYHLQIMQGDLSRRLQNLLPHIGHVQIAAVPDRGEPDRGEVDYRHILTHLDAIGYDGYVGAEYKPRTTTEEGLGWMAQLKAQGSI